MSNRELPPVAKELIAAKKRIENPENWCAGAYRRGERMCAAGALGADNHTGLRGVAVKASIQLTRAAEELYQENYVVVNDKRGHSSILKCFDHAITRAIKEGK